MPCCTHHQLSTATSAGNAKLLCCSVVALLSLFSLALPSWKQQLQRIDIVCTGSKPSWTAKLAGNQELLCSKIREEAGELCQTLEQQEGKDRATSEMADLLYHSMVLLNVQVRLQLAFDC